LARPLLSKVFDMTPTRLQLQNFIAPLILWSSIVAIILAASVARAETKKRAVPVYDGRAPACTTPTDVVLWVPGLALLPIRIVVDYGVRTPVGWLTRSVEDSRTARRVFRYVFLQPRTPTPAIFPVALYDFGTQPSVGGRLLWDYGFLTPGSRLSIKLGTGGLDWWRTDISTRVAAGRAFASIDASAHRQPDFRYYGIGPRTPEHAVARYGARNAMVRLTARVRPTAGSVASVFGAATTTSFRSNGWGGDPTIESRTMSGEIAGLPVGYPNGYSTLRVGSNVGLDTRTGEKHTRSGARLDAKLERVWDADETHHAWSRLEARVGGELMLDPVAERQLDVKLEFQLVDGDPAKTPFLELASVAGSGRMRGFPTGRLYDASAASLIVEYQWPVSAWLDVRAHAGAGNVFGKNLSGVSAGALRGSFGLSLSLAGLSEERQIAISTAVGTEPFEQGLDLTSFRLVIGFLHDY
jgi:hypothetical protein